MPIQIYKLTRTGGTSIRFTGKDGTDFTDPSGLANLQIARIIGKRLTAYVRCEVGGGNAEILGEATSEEIGQYEGIPKISADEEGDAPNPFKFPGR